MSNQIKVLGNRVVVEIISNQDDEQERLQAAAKKSGLMVPPPKDDPTKAHSAPVLGRVYALGPDAGDSLKVGDLVAYREKQPHGFNHDGKKLLALYIDQIDVVLGSE